MKTPTFIASLVLAGLAFAAQAQEERVEVPNYKDPFLKSYTQMLKGLRAYEEQHQHAPQSELYFILLPVSGKSDLKGLAMRLASDDESIPVPIDESGRFKLPLVEQKKDGEYDLILNKPKSQFRVRPYVKSAGLPDDSKRLGDLRLECQVRWAIEKQDVSAVFLTYVGLLASGNPCTSRTVSVGFFAPQGVGTVTLDTPREKIVEKVTPYTAYHFPIWDTTISDDSLIKYAPAGM